MVLSRAADTRPTGPHAIASAIRKLRPGCGPKKTVRFSIAAPLSLQVTKVKYGVEITSTKLNLTCNCIPFHELKQLVLDVNNKCHVVGFEEVADNPVVATNSNVAGWSEILVMANSINTMDKK